MPEGINANAIYVFNTLHILIEQDLICSQW